MPSQAETEEDHEQQKSKKPADTAFKQQRLPAWQPIITANTALPVFLIIGLTFIPIGIVLVITSERVLEYDIDYTDTKCLSTGTQDTCAQVLEKANYTGQTCTCTINFSLDKAFDGDVYFYYGLINYYQNHRRYVRSRDDNQLLGKEGDAASDCQPYQKGNYNGTDKNYTPCGAIANSKFNDTLYLLYNGNVNVTLTNLGIAWSTDKAVKFKNPNNAATYFSSYPKPPNWQITAWDLDKSNDDNNGYQNEDFIVWMRTAAMPTFRKLYRKLQRNSGGTFENGLPQGNYSLVVTYNYPVTSFAGRKQFIISTTSWMGGKNPFLGWAYIAVGIVCMITFVVFFILHKTWKTYSSECSLKEESSQVTLISSPIKLPSSPRQKFNNISSETCNKSSNISGTIYYFNETNSDKQTDVMSLPNNESSNIKMFVISSPSNSDDISFEENKSILNELTDNVNLSSLSYLKTKQRKIDHRRNKSEPVINSNLEDISSINSYKRTTILESSSTSTTSNESAISNNEYFEKKKKSSKKSNLSSTNSNKINENNTSSQIQDKFSSSSTTKKKKPWYFVSYSYLHFLFVFQNKIST
ncbi:unnamed protein product [Rotaria sp. Silwood2]|nr:unnamed protein product [Rotaria sp. Silwood2]